MMYLNDAKLEKNVNKEIDTVNVIISIIFFTSISYIIIQFI